MILAGCTRPNSTIFQPSVLQGKAGIWWGVTQNTIFTQDKSKLFSPSVGVIQDMYLETAGESWRGTGVIWFFLALHFNISKSWQNFLEIKGAAVALKVMHFRLGHPLALLCRHTSCHVRYTACRGLVWVHGVKPVSITQSLRGQFLKHLSIPLHTCSLYSPECLLGNFPGINISVQNCYEHDGDGQGLSAAGYWLWI